MEPTPMADPTPPDNPPVPPASPIPPDGRLKLAVQLFLAVGWVVAVAVALYRGEAPPAPPVLNDTATVDYAPVTGWVPDEAAIESNRDPAKTPQFDATPAGRVAMGDTDAFLWQPVLKLTGGKYPNENQGSVGSCVGAGFKHCVDVVQAVQIAAGQGGTFKPVSIEAIYALSRVEIGGGRISGDGSVGAWAKAAVERYGVLPMASYPGADLSRYDPARARAWGRTGLPDELEPAARDHPVKGAALVKTWPDVQRAISQGYPVAVCSNQGFRMQRDADGFAAPQGSWAHCMAIIGVRGAPRPGAFILNSWGNAAHTGPVWPADAPVAGFWADASTVGRMVAQGDSFALADLAGFPARPVDWFAVRPLPKRMPAPTDLALAW
jgi:hypothetical protein